MTSSPEIAADQPTGGFRLAGSTSTYLRQHASNPVDWWPWGEGAFAEAVARDVPILLSVGYASCHWCHVMARESFTDPAVAALINVHFVAVKVDREERPDVDAAYMSATTALTGQGGWPMTCFLTHDARPFYAGTYFPPGPGSGLPSFRQLLEAVFEAWASRREEVIGAAGRIRDSIAEAMGVDLSQGPDDLGSADLESAVVTVLAQIDQREGGFRGAPKFPPAMICEFLLRHHERTGSVPALAAVDLTLQRMAAGGIHDQLGGGFARYSVDGHWHVPHFEKMLDDNALLLRLYSHHGRRTGSDRSRWVAGGIGDFLLGTLRTAEGSFAASLDADTRGVEGATYLWTPAQLVAVLGEFDGSYAAQIFGLAEPADGCEPGGVLRLLNEPEDPERFARVRETLLAARASRDQPGRDDIVVMSSNGLVIAALAEAGAADDRPDWIRAAKAAAGYLLRVHRVDGRWRRASRGGESGAAPAVLVDHANLASGFLALFQATGDLVWLAEALDLLELGVWLFSDPAGGFHDVAAEVPRLYIRPRDLGDGAAPSGTSAMVDALQTAAALTGSPTLRLALDQAVKGIAMMAVRAPRSAGWHLAAAEARIAGPLQIAVSGAPSVERDALAAAARRWAPGGSVIDVGEPDAPGRELLANRVFTDGGPAAFVCRGFVCERPVNDVTALIAQLVEESD